MAFSTFIATFALQVVPYSQVGARADTAKRAGWLCRPATFEYACSHAASHAGCDTDGPIFNLQGRRLSSPQQAEQYQIYITNGKKVMKR